MQLELTARTITGLISLSVATTGVICANHFVTMMIGEINRQRQEGNLLSYFGFTFPKMHCIFREYRRSYPNGKLHLFALAAGGLAFVGIISFGVCFHIIG